MIEPDTIHVGVLRVVLVIPGARSLKDRRGVVRSMRDRIRARFHVSCHELSGDLPSRGELLVTTGGRDGAVVSQALDRIQSFVSSQGRATILDMRADVLAWSGGEADGFHL